MPDLARGLRSTVHQLQNGFRSLHVAPRQLWLVYIVKFLESYNYFSLAVTFTVYLSEGFGISDLEAGSIYGLWGTLLTSYGFILGPIIDYIGIRGSLVTCFLLGIFSRFVVAVTTNKVILYVALLGPLTVSGSLGVPVMTIAVKRFTNTGNRGFAYALFYTVMNVAALLSGLLFDVFRKTLRHGLNLVGASDDTVWNNGYRMFVLSGCVTSALGMILSMFIADPMKAARSAADEAESGAGTTSLTTPLITDDSSHTDAAGPKAKDDPPRLRLRKVLNRSSSIFAEVDMVELGKYVAMCVISVNLKTIFRHLEATLPKYRIRAFGCGTAVGLIYSINPAMILLLVPPVGAITQAFQHFDMIHMGGYISALSPLWIVAFSTDWSSIPFVIMLSVGEAIWSPRWYDYSMSVAPDGREGLFTACGSAPLFLATLPTGVISGKLLEVFCPDGHACDPKHKPDPHAPGCNGRILWLIITAITLSSPILITCLQHWLRPKPTAKQQLDALLIMDEDNPDNLAQPIVGPIDERQVFGELEAERHEGGIIVGAHGPSARAHGPMRNRPADRRHSSDAAQLPAM